MRRFFVLVTKEIKELLAPTMIVPMIIMVVFFVAIGQMLGSEAEKANAPQNISVLDEDQTATSQMVTDVLSKHNFNVSLYKGASVDTVIQETKAKGGASAIAIPAGFEKGIKEGKEQQVEVYTVVNNFSLMGSRSAGWVDSALTAINEGLSNQLILQAAPGSNPANLKNPVVRNDFVLVGARMANITPGEVGGFISSQTTIIPVVLFIVIIMAATTIATSVASEKENKTLETLLSTPISRTALVAAKMAAAGIVSLVMSVIYMFALQYYMGGVMGSVGADTSVQMSDAIKQLGLVIDPMGYALLGLSLFFGILSALALAIIIGAFAEDVKGVNGLITPLIFLIMIPYLLVSFLNVDTAAPVLKYLVYAIPFSHPFLAGPSLFLHDYMRVIYGVIYQAAFFVLFLTIAARIFSSDRLLTMKLSFKRSTLKFSR